MVQTDAKQADLIHELPPHNPSVCVRFLRLAGSCFSVGLAAASMAQGLPLASSVQVEERPYFLVNDMEIGSLKDKLQSCGNGPFSKTSFSIGH